MDKLRTKRLALAVGVATADFVVLRGAQDFEPAARAPQAAADREARHPGLERRHDQGRARRGSAAAYALAVQLETLVFAEAVDPGT